MQNLLINRCKNSENSYVQKLKKLLVSDKKCPISSVFSQIMRIFASGKLFNPLKL